MNIEFCLIFHFFILVLNILWIWNSVFYFIFLYNKDTKFIIISLISKFSNWRERLEYLYKIQRKKN